MTKTVKRYAFLLIVLLIGVFAVACSPKDPNGNINANSVEFNGQATFVILGKPNVSLAPTVVPSNAKQQTFTWTSSNTDIAEVNQMGVITAKTIGEVTIKAALQGTDLVAEQTVDVYYAATDVDVITDTTELVAGHPTLGKTVFASQVLPAGSRQEVNYRSSNPSVLAVNSVTGEITAQPQTTGFVKTASVLVEVDGASTIDDQTIEKEIPIDLYSIPTGITLSLAEASHNEIYVGGAGNLGSAQLEAVVNSQDTAKQDVVFSTSDNIASVNQAGLVVATDLGNKEPVTATITATVNKFDNNQATQEITVYAAPTSLTIATPFGRGDEPTENEDGSQYVTTRRYAVGSQLELSASVQPFNAKQTITWTSSDETVATVDENGLFTAVKASNEPVTITATDFFRQVSHTINFIVEVSPNHYRDENAIDTVVGRTEIFAPVLIGGNQEELRGNRFVSTNPSVASIDNRGYVQAIAEGQGQLLVGTPVSDHGDDQTAAEQVLWHAAIVTVTVVTRANDFVSQYSDLASITNSQIENGYDAQRVVDLYTRLQSAQTYITDIEATEPESVQNEAYTALATKTNELTEIVLNQIENRQSEAVKNYRKEFDATMLEVQTTLADLANEVLIFGLTYDASNADNAQIIAGFVATLNDLIASVQGLQEYLAPVVEGLNPDQEGYAIDQFLVDQLTSGLELVNKSLTGLQTILDQFDNVINGGQPEAELAA